MDVRFGAYRFRRRERSLDGPDGQLDISGRSFDILDVLLRHPNEAVSKATLFDSVWPGLVVEENTLQAHISALRKALGASIIVTVHGRGYKYAGPQPTAIGDEEAPPRAPPLAPMAFPPDRKPVIAVLPFANLSGDPDQQYFSDGVTRISSIACRNTASCRSLAIIHPSRCGQARKTTKTFVTSSRPTMC
jgi:DNA-binding winged helix-turn-helix (wHTH) protein